VYPVASQILGPAAAAAMIGAALAGCSLQRAEPNPSASPAATVTTTVTESATSAAPSRPPESVVPTADPADFKRGDNYYFVSASTKWDCGILLLPSPRAGCHGPLPATAPRVPGSGAPNVLVAPNVISVGGNDVPARFSSVGDPQFSPITASGALAKGTVLPYLERLTVGDFTCSITESVGVTCDNTRTGHGFTVSDYAFELR
jgi:hypothetical protein